MHLIQHIFLISSLVFNLANASPYPNHALCDNHSSLQRRGACLSHFKPEKKSSNQAQVPGIQSEPDVSLRDLDDGTGESFRTARTAASLRTGGTFRTARTAGDAESFRTAGSLRTGGSFKSLGSLVPPESFATAESFAGRSSRDSSPVRLSSKDRSLINSPLRMNVPPRDTWTLPAHIAAALDRDSNTRAQSKQEFFKQFRVPDFPPAYKASVSPLKPRLRLDPPENEAFSTIPPGTLAMLSAPPSPRTSERSLRRRGACLSANQESNPECQPHARASAVELSGGVARSDSSDRVLMQSPPPLPEPPETVSHPFTHGYIADTESSTSSHHPTDLMSVFPEHPASHPQSTSFQQPPDSPVRSPRRRPPRLTIPTDLDFSTPPEGAYLSEPTAPHKPHLPSLRRPLSAPASPKSLPETPRSFHAGNIASSSDETRPSCYGPEASYCILSCYCTPSGVLNCDKRHREDPELAGQHTIREYHTVALSAMCRPVCGCPDPATPGKKKYTKMTPEELMHMGHIHGHLAGAFAAGHKFGEEGGLKTVDAGSGDAGSGNSAAGSLSELEKFTSGELATKGGAGRGDVGSGDTSDAGSVPDVKVAKKYESGHW
jgi:hypothetical protein